MRTVRAGFGQSVHLAAFGKTPEALKDQIVAWYHHSREKGRYKINYKYVLINDDNFYNECFGVNHNSYDKQNLSQSLTQFIVAPCWERGLVLHLSFVLDFHEENLDLYHNYYCYVTESLLE